MTREEAEARARELAAEDETHGYFPRKRDGEWEIVKLAAGPGRVHPTGTATEERPRPEPDDPRTSSQRQIPPFGGAPF